jgi:hypothetical protein
MLSATPQPDTPMVARPSRRKKAQKAFLPVSRGRRGLGSGG